MEPPPHMSAEAVHTWDRAWVRLPLFALIALVGGLLGSFTLSANLLVLGVGGALIWLGTTGRVARRHALLRLPRSAAWWLLPLLMLAGVELFTFSMKSTEEYPTLSLLADPILEGYLARAVVYFGWLVGFWGLIRR